MKESKPAREATVTLKELEPELKSSKVQKLKSLKLENRRLIPFLADILLLFSLKFGLKRS